MNKEISIKEIRKKLKEIFPQFSETYQILDIKNCYSEVKLLSNKINLRPGNTISGPSMFKLADISFYVAVMGSVKLIEKSVSINVSINFLNKPLLSNLIGISKIKKLGKRIVVGDVEILSEDKKIIFANAFFTYSISNN
jgi:acyl-coenzyme A thioesterase PaaI-like protein